MAVIDITSGRLIRPGVHNELRLGSETPLATRALRWDHFAVDPRSTIEEAPFPDAAPAFKTSMSSFKPHMSPRPTARPERDSISTASASVGANFSWPTRE